MTRHSYVLPEQKLVVFWTPKAACSSVAEAVARSVLSAKELKNLTPDSGGPRVLLNQLGYMKSGPEGRQIAEKRGYQSWAVIRDPYDRLISAYINKFVTYNNRPIYTYRDMEPFAFQFVRDNAKALGLRRKPSLRNKWMGMSFRCFVTTVCDVIDKTPDRGRALNQHWNTQIPEAFRKAEFDFDNVYILKTINRFFKTLEAETGVALQIPKRNVSPYKIEIRQNYCDLSSLEILEKDGFSKRCFNDPDLRARVKRSFKTDYHYIQKAA